MIPSTGSLLQLYQSQRARSLQLKPGPSDIGGCERRFAYKLAETPQTNVSASTQAAIGVAIHEKVAEAASELNEAKNLGWLVEHEVTYAGISGTMDLYAESTVVDHKSVGDRAFESVGVHGPYLSHIWQVHWYAAGAVQAGLKVKEVRINYINRDSGKERIFTMPFDLKILRDATAWVQRIRSTPLEAVPRSYAPSSIFCSNCPVRDMCWQGGVPDRDPRSVEYVDAEKNGLIEELYEARQGIKALKSKENRLKGVLDAVRPDDLAVYVVGEKRAVQWRVRYKADGTESYSLYFVTHPDVETS